MSSPVPSTSLLSWRLVLGCRRPTVSMQAGWTGSGRGFGHLDDGARWKPGAASMRNTWVRWGVRALILWFGVCRCGGLTVATFSNFRGFRRKCGMRARSRLFFVWTQWNFGESGESERWSGLDGPGASWG
ncbi:hypothetical protein K438DRAFT_2135984 [Mycena galopus ATCC 62051]|nr:hypothetical protein K438DRAFT_2135984 [Mycena galopus ATCC 62051]